VGVTVVEHHREEMDEAALASLIQRLRAISDELLATKSHAGAIKLIEGQLEADAWGGRRLFVAYSSQYPRRIEGFLVALPMDNGRKWSFEMYRRRTDAVRGVVPHLFHEVMIRLKAEGIEARRLRHDASRTDVCQEPPQRPVRLRRSLSFQEPVSTALRKSLHLRFSQDDVAQHLRAVSN